MKDVQIRTGIDQFQDQKLSDAQAMKLKGGSTEPLPPTPSPGLSNMLKSMHDTGKAIIQNIKV